MRTGGTLVFLMGVSALPAICRGLLDAGMATDTPAATVESGTTPAQRRTSATLADLPRRAAEVGVKSPAVIVVGQVCALAEQFDWFDRLPLKGKTVVVTRPKERAGTLSGRLRSLGADVWEYPCIATVPIDPCPGLEEAMEGLGEYQWLALTSPAGGGRPVALAGGAQSGRPDSGRAQAGRHRARNSQGPVRPRPAGGLRAGGVRRRPPGGGHPRRRAGADPPGPGGAPPP